jgi:hypothetical protein
MANSITPPPELSDEQVGNWLIDDGYPWEPSEQAVITITTSRLKNVARQAFQAGADQELKACCDWFQDFYKLETWMERDLKAFRVARRPKPPSLKEQALEIIKRGEDDWQPLPEDWDIIRRALEALDD